MKVTKFSLARRKGFARFVAGSLSLLLLACMACRDPDPVTRSDELIASGRAGEAITLLREAIDERPDDDGLQLAYARALSAGGMRVLAEWPLRRAMRVEQWRRSAGLALAENAVAMRNLDVAIETLSELLRDDPDDIEVLLRRADAYAATRTNLDAALEDVDRVRALAPDELRAYRPEIQAYLHAAMTDDAAAAIEELGERLEEEGGFDDDETDRWFCVTRALFEQESLRFDEATIRWETCLAHHPTSLEVVSEASAFFESRGDMARALQIIEAAVEATDLTEGLVFRTGLAQRLRALGRIEEAIALLEPGTEAVVPETVLAYWNVIAALYDASGRPREALEAASRALALADELGVATADQRFAAGDLAIRSGDLERAERIAEEIGTPNLRGLLEARILHDRGAFEEAVTRYEEVARLWPDNAFLRYHEARALEQLGDLDRAIELYRHATRIEATATDAQTRIALILEAEGRFGDALRVLATQGSRGPLDLESELVFARLLGRTVAPEELRAQIVAWQGRQPAAIVEGLTAFACGMRQRGEARAALSLFGVLDPHGLVQSRAGPDFVREMLRAKQEAGEQHEELDATIDRALELEDHSAAWLAVDGYRAELADDTRRALARYASALAEDASLRWVVAARSRLHAADSPDDASTAASILLETAESERDLDEAVTIIRALMHAGHVAQSQRAFLVLLDRRPYDVEAALAICALEPGPEVDALPMNRLHALSRRMNRLDRSCPAAVQRQTSESPAAPDQSSRSGVTHGESQRRPTDS